MKKKILIVLSILMISTIALGGIYILAEEDPEIVSGSYTIFTENADYIKIADKTIQKTISENAVNTITIKVTGCESKLSSVSLNETVLGYLVEGENTFQFNNSILKDGENEIKILLTAGTATFNDSQKYGEYNLDDTVISSVSITMGVFEPIIPSDMIKYMPVVGNSGATVVRSAYAESQTIGDGWSSETKLGGSTPNVPIYIGYIFEKPSDDTTYFTIDTTEFEDGDYNIDAFSDNNIVETYAIRIDNTAPELKLSFNNGDVIANSNTITFDATDNLPVTVTAKIDNVAVSGHSASLKSFTEGSHILYLLASDSLGNTVEKMYTFTVEQTIPDYSLTNNNGTAVLTIPENANAKIYSVNLIGRINMYFNRVGSYTMTSLRSSDEVLASFADKQDVTTESVGNTLPYQSFVVEVGTNIGDALISYSGETGSGEDILLQGWNYITSTWDTLARTESGVSISFKADIATYSIDGKMRIKACPYVLSNGSDTLLWLSDPQYYSRYEDLNYLYTDAVNFAKNEYIAGNIAYVVNTGDLVDQTDSGDAVANTQYQFASDMQAILDDALVPNGVVSGNHDIKHTSADYSYFNKYFGSDRYDDFEWYGGNFKDNTHHYDLITIGNYDFVFLYIGCYDETSSDTIAWANAVIQAYSERNVILCTHEYILPSGAYSGDRAEVIWDEIVVPNENVKMILCGHNPGAANQLHQVEDTDRYVLEILADYQFAELDNDVAHVENGCTCDGEGFVRLMTFNEAGQVITSTYSPSAEKYNYYPSYIDSFVYDLALIPAVRSIKTTAFSIGVNIKEEGIFGVDKINIPEADGMYAVITEGDIEYTTEILTLNDTTVTYPVIADTTKYNFDFTRYEITGMSGVAAMLRHGEHNQMPSEDLVENGLDLIPTEENKINRTSGSTDFIPTYTEDGKFILKFTADTTNTWVTTVLTINKKIDISEYNRLYFGVSADTNAKWNIVVNLSNGTALNFSQSLYKMFGYDTYNIPSDIQGTWQGYIPLGEYLDEEGEVTISGIYFVSATAATPITFDYLFIGKSMGEEVLFHTDENTSYSLDVLAGEKVEQLSNPVKLGYSFDGWFTAQDGGELVLFPAKVNAGGLTAYAHFTKKDAAGANAGTIYYNDEVEVLPGTDYNEVVIISIIGLTLLAGIVAAIISTLRHKKKMKTAK